MEEYIGSISLFVGTYAPEYYLFCHGQQLLIEQYQALYSIIGTTYGGNGVNYFNLPDFRSRTAIGAGNGAGLSSVQLGEKRGTETVSGRNTLVQAAQPNLPSVSVSKGNVYDNRQPSMGVNFIICVEGIYPTQD
jgi:microcystin-dependent protein